jgi:2-polyprenyl-6-methoxyphenol hydroxylase-like FAD-dependent oxidoreductase
MAKVVIAGGGISGLAAALYLAKQDHDVTIFERDRAPTPETAAEAFEWDRRGAPQVRHSHAMLARLRNLLHEDHPDVLRRLLEAGATEIKMIESRPSGPGASEPDPADEEIVMIASRRTTLEWVLRTSVLETGRVNFCSGTGVAGLEADSGNTPKIRGVFLDDGTRHSADIVIAADGRKSEAPKWLRGLGVELEPEIREPAGIVYYSRFYRLREGLEFPSTDLVAGDIGYLGFAAFCGDNGTFSITFSVPDDDAKLRRATNQPKIFESIARMIPETAEWTRRAEPITPVYSMAGLVNRHRHFLHDGAACVAGFHVIGDAHVCTNPAYGRGLSTGFWQASLLAEAIRANPEDRIEQSLQFCGAIEKHITPWFDAAVMMDRMRSATRANGATDPNAAPQENPMKALAAAASVDAYVWRMFWRTMNLLEPPETLMQPEFLARIAQAAPAESSNIDVSSGSPLPTRAEFDALLESQET